MTFSIIQTSLISFSGACMHSNRLCAFFNLQTRETSVSRTRFQCNTLPRHPRQDLETSSSGLGGILGASSSGLGGNLVRIWGHPHQIRGQPRQDLGTSLSGFGDILIRIRGQPRQDLGTSSSGLVGNLVKIWGHPHQD